MLHHAAFGGITHDDANLEDVACHAVVAGDRRLKLSLADEPILVPVVVETHEATELVPLLTKLLLQNISILPDRGSVILMVLPVRSDQICQHSLTARTFSRYCESCKCAVAGEMARKGA